MGRGLGPTEIGSGLLQPARAGYAAGVQTVEGMSGGDKGAWFGGGDDTGCVQRSLQGTCQHNQGGH